MDAACHHLGGALVNGDIEELGGATCVRCPWHHRRVEVESGREVVRSERGGWALSGKQVQRTHAVEAIAGLVWVDVDDSGPPLPSDRYSACSASAASPSATPTRPPRPEAQPPPPSPQAYLLPYALPARLPPPPPPLSALDALTASPSNVPGIAFRAERNRAATEAVVSKRVAPRVLFGGDGSNQLATDMDF